MSATKLSDRSSIQKQVEQALAAEPVVDMHTHLYPPTFGTPDPNKTGKTDPAGYMLWGLDELLTYHYLVAEVFRVAPAFSRGGGPVSGGVSHEQFWKMPKAAQA